MNRRGVALPIALLLLALLGALAGAALLSSRGRGLAGERLLDRARLDLTARGEVELALSSWSSQQLDTLAPGAMVSLLPRLTGPGIRLTDTVHRLGSGSFLFRALAERRAAGNTLLARSEVGYLVWPQGPTLPEFGGVVGTGPVALGDAALADGLGAEPAASWSSRCPPPGPAVPGVRAAGPVTDCPGGCIRGGPAVVLDSALTAARLSQLGPVSLADLLAVADHRVNGAVAAPAPVLQGGECDRLAAGNWGDPAASGGPCAGWFPIVAAASGAVILDGVGQGMLLGTGRLVLGGDFRFTGVVLAVGPVELRDRVVIDGALVALDSAALHDEVAVRWSYCAVMMAGRGLSRPVPGNGRVILPGK